MLDPNLIYSVAPVAVVVCPYLISKRVSSRITRDVFVSSSLAVHKREKLLVPSYSKIDFHC